MTLTTVRYGLADGVATITLNRPDSRNALNRAMCEDLVSAAAAVVADDARLVLVRGAGPVFCAGADLKERKDMSADEVRNRRLRGFAAYHALESLPMPTIAVVHGAAVGRLCSRLAPGEDADALARDTLEAVVTGLRAGFPATFHPVSWTDPSAVSK